MKFLVPNYSCLQNPWLGGYRSQIPVSLSSVLNLICWTPPRTKFLGTPLCVRGVYVTVLWQYGQDSCVRALMPSSLVTRIINVRISWKRTNVLINWTAFSFSTKMMLFEFFFYHIHLLWFCQLSVFCEGWLLSRGCCVTVVYQEPDEWNYNLGAFHEGVLVRTARHREAEKKKAHNIPVTLQICSILFPPLNFPAVWRTSLLS